MTRQCVVCGKGFDCPPSSKKVTCSPEHSKIRKSQTHTGKSNQWSSEAKSKWADQYPADNLKNGTKAAQASPNSGRFETNLNAKTWRLKTPENNVIEVKNLTKWARENASLFGEENTDAAAERIRSGFTQIKRSMEGKRGSENGRGVGSYKGWQLIGWDESDINKRHKKSAEE